MDRIKAFFELRAFGVCSFLGEVLFIPSSLIRLFFIYTAFVAVGSPMIIIYLVIAFLLKLRNYFRVRRSVVWDL